MSTQQLENRLLEVYEPAPFDGGSDPAETRTMLTDAAVDLLSIVGYDQRHVFSDLMFETPSRIGESIGLDILRVDAAAARTISSPLYLAIITYVSSEAALRRDPSSQSISLKHTDSEFFDACIRTSHAHCTVLLTNAYIAVFDMQSGAQVIPLSEFSQNRAEDLLETISPPENEKFPSGRNTRFPAGYHPDQTKLTRWLFADTGIVPKYQVEINTPYFRIEISDYSEHLYDAYMANSSNDKGNKLEQVASLLFEGLTMMSVRDQNLQTKTGEIDIILEYSGFDSLNFFDYYSRFVLVECKNTADPVPAKEVGYFRSKLRDSDVDLGLLISWNGVTGEEDEKNGERAANRSLLDDPLVLILTSRDLYRILDGKSLYELLDEKLYAQRFDL